VRTTVRKYAQQQPSLGVFQLIITRTLSHLIHRLWLCGLQTLMLVLALSRELFLFWKCGTISKQIAWGYIKILKVAINQSNNFLYAGFEHVSFKIWAKRGFFGSNNLEKSLKLS
jgi:hypothetical protein